MLSVHDIIDKESALGEDDSGQFFKRKAAGSSYLPCSNQVYWSVGVDASRGLCAGEGGTHILWGIRGIYSSNL